MSHRGDQPVCRVAVTGASGFVGRALSAELHNRGFDVVALSRRPDRLTLPRSMERRHFDPGDSRANAEAFEGCDAVVHLAGETVAGRWTDEKKHAIRRSRVDGTRAVVASMRACLTPPAVLVSASASGYYGDRNDEPLDENAAPGDDFLARVCRDWEREAREAESFGTRCVQLRTGIVLGRDGALKAMIPPFRLGFGGPFGSGKQFVPWIHIDDLVALYVHALEHAGICGPLNAVAPDYATSARFAQALGAALHRPALLPAPGFALRAALGEFADTILAGQLMLPAVAEDTRFIWAHDNLERALFAIFDRTDEPTLLRTYESHQRLPHPIVAVFPFFAEAENLQSITPPALRFSIRSVSGVLRRGTIIEYALRLHGVPFRWKTMIARWEPPFLFEDVQLRGPYALWRHRHEFAPQDGGGVAMSDNVQYVLPFHPLGKIALPLVRSDVRAIFAHRAKAVSRLIYSRDGSHG